MGNRVKKDLLEWGFALYFFKEMVLSMEKSIFERKIYSEILDWKENRSDKYALLIKGARRVGDHF